MNGLSCVIVRGEVTGAAQACPTGARYLTRLELVWLQESPPLTPCFSIRESLPDLFLAGSRVRPNRISEVFNDGEIQRPVLCIDGARS